ncbi:vWA domain-containing protein [Verrucomicrobium spinosum]|uniref:vWA domain-containing protein n=1 Tax=Verrucomicrobium spinosum TaxID=2736 RepID=UPI0004929040|nr:VWA domain-containing protein [Verrucomicrobium spinosum]
MRRLPVYLLIDTSGSMKGEPLESVKVGLQAMLSGLRQDPHALESLHLSIITFDREVKVVLPLSSLETLQLPPIVCPDSGPTNLGAALEVLCQRVDTEVLKSQGENKGDWKPILFVMTDGSPSDIMLYKETVPQVKKRGFASIIACAAGPKARKDELLPLADHVVTLDTMDSGSFLSFFRWVSSSVAAGNVSMGASTEIHLPPPPPEVNLVF